MVHPIITAELMAARIHGKESKSQIISTGGGGGGGGGMLCIIYLKRDF